MKSITNYIDAPFTNREKSKIAKRERFWCSKCDRDVVSQTGKCTTCGRRVNRKKLRL